MHKFIILAAITILATSCQLAGIFTAGNKLEVGGKEATFVKEGYSVPVFSGEEFGGTDLPDVNGTLMFQTYGADKKTNYYSVYVVNPGTLKLKYKLTADNASEYFIGANGDTVSEGAWSDVKKTLKIPFSLKEGADKKDIKFNLSVWSSMRSYEITQPDKIHINNRPPVIYPVADSLGADVTAEWKPVFNGTSNTSTIYWKYNSAGHTDIKRFKVIYSVAGNDSEAYVDYVNDITNVYLCSVGDISSVDKTVEFAIFAYDTEGLDSGYVATGTFTPKKADAPTITRGTGADYNTITVTAADGTTLSSVTLNGTPQTITGGGMTATFNLDSTITTPQTVSATAVRSGYINGTATGNFIYDKDPPADVTDLTTVTGDAKVTLNWTPSTGDGVGSGFKEYRIFQGGSQIAVIENSATSSYQISSGLTNGTQYTFTIKAVDQLDHVSAGVTAKATPLNLDAARATAGVPGATVSNFMINGRTVTLSPYEIGKYEVTYELWWTVKQWATTDATKKYTFANSGCEGYTGTEGSSTTDAKNEPVTNINPSDAAVWCNAYTEWYNANNGTDLECAYYTDTGYGTVIRNSNSTPILKTTADGYRLPTPSEWEYAARYNNSGNLKTGDGLLSGAASNSEDDSKKVAWYGGFYGERTYPVGGKDLNSMGCFDMSGNVWEICWSMIDKTSGDYIDPISGTNHEIRGGCFNSGVNDCKVNGSGGFYSSLHKHYGFRVARWLPGGTVTFNSNGGGTVSPQKIRKNGLVKEPTPPTKSGYVFAGWYKDNTFATEWNFTTDRVSADMTLYARFLENLVNNYDFSAGTANWGIVDGGGGSIAWSTAYKSYPDHNYAFAAAGGDLVFGDYTSTVSQTVILPGLTSKSKITISIYATAYASGTGGGYTTEDNINVKWTLYDGTSNLGSNNCDYTLDANDGFLWITLEITLDSTYKTADSLKLEIKGNDKGGWAGNYGAVIDKVIVAAE